VIEEILENIIETLSPNGEQYIVENPKAAQLRNDLQTTLRNLQGKNVESKTDVAKKTASLVSTYSNELPKIVESNKQALTQIKRYYFL